MSARATILVWLVLLLLLGVEIATSYFDGVQFAALLIGAAMAVLVALTFMDLPGAGSTAAVFAVAAVFWMGILLGLGSMDSATRHDVPLSTRTQP